MCRLWGISYGEQQERLTPAQMARILFPALTAGGPHAYGWANLTDGAVRVRKYQGRADTTNALATLNIERASRWVIGHTRYATHGSPSYMGNNHPIVHGNFVGVHNGILRNHESILAETGRQDSKATVDSEAIFAAVNKWGTLKGLRRISGDMVSIFCDTRNPERIYLARSYGRQVSIGQTKRGNLIWASERQALAKLEKHGVEFAWVSQLRENRVLAIEGGQIVKRRTFAKPVTSMTPPLASASESVMDEWRHHREWRQREIARRQAAGQPFVSGITDHFDRRKQHMAGVETRVVERNEDRTPKTYAYTPYCSCGWRGVRQSLEHAREAAQYHSANPPADKSKKKRKQGKPANNPVQWLDSESGKVSDERPPTDNRVWRNYNGVLVTEEEYDKLTDSQESFATES